MYEKMINQLNMYASVIRVLSKGYLPIFSFVPNEVKGNFKRSSRKLFKLPIHIMISLSKDYICIMV